MHIRIRSKPWFAAFLIALLLGPPAIAGRMSLLGAGVVSAGGSTFSGPGDQVAAWTFFASCSRAWSNAKANTSNLLCDLVAITGGGAVCTLRATTSGFVDLTAYCPGALTPSAACAAASGGSCRVTKLYDQTGNGNDMVQATLANMPDVSFSGLNSLPTFTCVGRGSTCVVASSTTFVSTTPPHNFWGVWRANTNPGNDVGIVGIDSASIALGNATAADSIRIFEGAGGVSLAGRLATLYHAASSLLSPAAGGTYLVNADGSGDQSATGIAVNNFPAATHLRCHRGDAGASQDVADIMECGMLVDQSTSWTTTQRNNLSVNAHDATNGYNF